MKKLSFLSLMLSVSFSFVQSQNKTTTDSRLAKESEKEIVKDNPAAYIDPILEPLSSTQTDNTVYSTARVEVKPEFPGGIRKFYAFVAKNYKIPSEGGLEGTVIVVFVVEKDGSLTNIQILKDIGYGTGKEAIRVLKLSPEWKPAELNGKKVRCSYSLPITLPNPEEVIYVK